MNICTVDINTLIFDKDNAKSHNRDNINAIKLSLSEFGQYLPVVVQKGTNVILVGNGTVEAALEAGMKQIAVCFVNVDASKAEMLAVLDNRSSELSFFDEEIINKFFYEVDNLSQKISGFTDNEIVDIMNKLDSGSQYDLTEKKNIPNVECPHCGFKFKREEK